MDLLEHLIQFSSESLPITGKLYGDDKKKWNLKQGVDSIRNNWFPTEPQSKRLTPDVMVQFEEKVSWWNTYIEGLRQKREKRPSKVRESTKKESPKTQRTAKKRSISETISKTPLLDYLIKWSPDVLPLTGKTYGDENRDLKREIDDIRDNWFPERQPIRKLSQKEKHDYMLNVPFWASYINGLRQKRKVCFAKRCEMQKKGYDASTFTCHHEDFKNKMASMFADYVRQLCPSGNWLVLDDFSKSSDKLRTISALKAATSDSSISPPGQVYMCNPGARQVSAAEKEGAVSVQKLCEKALAVEWRSVSYSAAYLDTCSGSVVYVGRLIDMILTHATNQFVIGVTLTGRDSQGQNILERVISLDSRIRSLGFDAPGESGLKNHMFFFKPNSVITAFYVRRR